MKERLYRIKLPDQSLPAFASGTTDYYGTEQMILQFLESKQAYHALQAPAKAYFSGQGTGMVSVMYEPSEPLIEEVKVLGTASYEKQDLKYKFFNTWGFSTDITIEHIKADLVYISDANSKLKRCVKATVKNAKHDGDGRWSMIWGLPGFIRFDAEDTLTNALFYADTVFPNLHALQKDQNRPHKVYLREFFFGIYGDG